MKSPLHIVGHSWAESSIYDADGNAIATSSIEGDATEENQEELEKLQEKRLGELIVAYNNTYGAGLNPEAVKEMRDALENAEVWLANCTPHIEATAENPLPLPMIRAALAKAKEVA